MAAIFEDDAEDGTTDLWDEKSGVAVESSAPIHGSYSFKIPSDAFLCHLGKEITPEDEYWLRLTLDPLGSWDTHLGGVVLFLDESDNIQCSLQLQSGVMKAYKSGRDGTQIGSDGDTLGAGITDIQIHVKVASSNGIFQTKINGVDDLDLTGEAIDTKGSGSSSNIAKIRIGYPEWYGTPNLLFDDVVIDNADWPGPYEEELPEPPEEIGEGSMFLLF